MSQVLARVDKQHLSSGARTACKILVCGQTSPLCQGCAQALPLTPEGHLCRLRRRKGYLSKVSCEMCSSSLGEGLSSAFILKVNQRGVSSSAWHFRPRSCPCIHVAVSFSSIRRTTCCSLSFCYMFEVLCLSSHLAPGETAFHISLCAHPYIQVN